MRKSIATVSMSGTLKENDLLYFNGSPAEVASLSADLGLTCELYQPFRDFEGVPDPLFRRNLDRAERKFDVMGALAAQLMLVCSNTSPQVIADEERMAAQLYELAERAAKRNLRIGFEALAWGRLVNLWSQAWSIVKRANHPHLGLILDSFHTLSLRDDPSGIAKLPGDKIFFMQLADAPLLAMDVLQWARHYRSFPGQGQFDLENFFEQVLRAGYTGPMSLEVFNDLFREAPNRRTAVDAMRSLLYLEGQVRSRFEAADGESDARRSRVIDRIELFDPPAIPVLSGFSFIEFAVDAASDRALASLLEGLGFARAGVHRSKRVTLYRQGDINLILNAEADAFVRNYFSEHGPSVCAMALRTDDPVRALNRGTALQCSRFDSRIGRNEAQICGIRAPNGSVIHFVPQSLGANGLFDIDFNLEGADAANGPGAGLQRIDHVALGLPHDQLDTWVLFCRAVLGLKPGESLELSDPFGLIRSCGVSNEDRSVRLVLNVSSSQKTTTARTISASGGGGGVHHIALSSGDIFASIEKLRVAGVEFVPISPNYYDDLVARLDIDQEQVERMRALGILYDRSPAGEYFHSYSRSFADRFFFEIVQRVGSYDAYGALNAPARMASQAQHAPTE
ncbi:MAG: sugar phosphate isomerase/epimerase and 4-hydroxyphenylpyruvate domain-containing protein [Betaproteobacteria bacterium]|nr:MAG: sugar phosphate isomerase/epimerase and 4-hydroxyphenylpyruvate domain-containing protein [Betaproteobacteria bacterium]